MKFNRRLGRDAVVEYKVMVKSLASRAEAAPKSGRGTGLPLTRIQELVSGLPHGGSLGENMTLLDAETLHGKPKALNVVAEVREQLTLSQEILLKSSRFLLNCGIVVVRLMTLTIWAIVVFALLVSWLRTNFVQVWHVLSVL